MMGQLLRVKIALIFLTCKLFADIDYSVTNTNFTISQGSIFPQDDTRYLYNYDRLRLRADYSDENFFATFIGDGVNYLGHDYVTSSSFEYIKLLKSDTSFATKSNYHDYYEGNVYAKLYRLYAGYEDEDNRVVIGLQNITMGVGRIWNPTNLFNPRNAYALEPDEIFPVTAISYTRHLNDTSHITVVASQKEDYTFKYALGYKIFLEFADFALNFVSSDETKMAGYEIEANLADTGIEVRSEGAYIENSLHVTIEGVKKIEFSQGIIGADYGFENGITLIVEALYSSQNFDYDEILININSEVLPNLLYSNFYIGSSLSYSFNLFLEGSLGYIESFNDKNSRYITPALSYTLNDFNTFSLGAMIQNGADGSEFGMFSNTYYFNYVLAF